MRGLGRKIKAAEGKLKTGYTFMDDSQGDTFLVTTMAWGPYKVRSKPFWVLVMCDAASRPVYHAQCVKTPWWGKLGVDRTFELHALTCAQRPTSLPVFWWCAATALPSCMVKTHIGCVSLTLEVLDLLGQSMQRRRPTAIVNEIVMLWHPARPQPHCRTFGKQQQPTRTNLLGKKHASGCHQYTFFF